MQSSVPAAVPAAAPNAPNKAEASSTPGIRIPARQPRPVPTPKLTTTTIIPRISLTLECRAFSSRSTAAGDEDRTDPKQAFHDVPPRSFDPFARFWARYAASNANLHHLIG